MQKVLCLKLEDPYITWKIEVEKTHSKIIYKSFFIKCIKDEINYIQIIDSIENTTYGVKNIKYKSNTKKNQMESTL